MIYFRQSELISDYVTRLFKTFTSPDLVYHNLEHTKNVVRRAQEIALHYSLNDKEQFILLASGWFHDCGHLFGPAHEHEKRSVMVMKAYMQPLGIENELTDMAGECILATKMPCEPNTLIAEILCDADLYHLGTEDFLTTDKLVKRELELRNGTLPGNNESTLRLLKTHHYFTSYCQALLGAGKLRNIAYIAGLTENNKS